RGVPLSQIALAWVLGNPAISTALVGARTPAEVDANDAGTELDLTSAERAKIETILAGAAGRGKEVTPLRPAMEPGGAEIPAGCGGGAGPGRGGGPAADEARVLAAQQLGRGRSAGARRPRVPGRRGRHRLGLGARPRLQRGPRVRSDRRQAVLRAADPSDLRG